MSAAYGCRSMLVEATGVLALGGGDDGDGCDDGVVPRLPSSKDQFHFRHDMLRVWASGADAGKAQEKPCRTFCITPEAWPAAIIASRCQVKDSSGSQEVFLEKATPTVVNDGMFILCLGPGTVARFVSAGIRTIAPASCNRQGFPSLCIDAQRHLRCQAQSIHFDSFVCVDLLPMCLSYFVRRTVGGEALAVISSSSFMEGGTAACAKDMFIRVILGDP